jgi:pyruvate kinase
VVFISDRREEQPTKLPVPCRHLVPIAAPFPFARLAAANVLRMKDATMAFRIVENHAPEGWILAVTDTGGVIRSEKGMNAPGVDRSAVALPAKDVADAKLAAELGAEALCVSFVTGAGELEAARKTLRDAAPDGTTAVWAKVECREAIDALDAVLGACDAVLVGRGDLAGELGPENVRAATDEIVKRTVAKGLPCHVGTNVLPGMCRDPRPSSDEREDALRLLKLGVNGFLLTAETSVGRNPDASVQALREILEHHRSRSR